MHTKEAKELTQGDWKKTSREHGITMSKTNPYSRVKKQNSFTHLPTTW